MARDNPGHGFDGGWGPDDDLPRRTLATGANRRDIPGTTPGQPRHVLTTGANRILTNELTN